MKFSESWLRTLANPSLSSAELSHLLTMAGLEVEEMVGVAPAFDKVVVAQVLSKEKHPDADRLNLLSVDVGQAEPLAIVCGAGNVTVGMKAPCALVGAKLPGIEIKQAKVRGIASFGMMCSAKELGLAEESSGLLELSADAVVGQSIREHLDLDDHLLTLKLTPNRCDCLSLNGIAREVAALTGTAMQAVPAASFKQTGTQSRKVSVAASAACPRYSGRVISGVNAKAATPAWMVQRLERCGLRSLGFGSDSSYRFERGVDFAATQIALDRATQLILDICGGQAGAVTEVLGTLPVRHPVRLRTSRVLRVLGIALAAGEIAQILSRLGMVFQQQGEEFLVTPPSYRFDIVIEEDLVEEVARVHGYENILPAPIQARMSILPLVEAQRPLSKLRQTMVLRDYQETINYAFVEAAWERDLCGNTAPIALKNPIASQMSVMRSSLLGGLLGALRTNLARKQPRVRLFEIGGCFANEAGAYVQHECLAGLAYGAVLSEQWGAAARNVDFFDVKGDVEALFAPRDLSFEAAVHPASHPGRSARILLDGKAVGWIGELHPQWQQQYDLPQALVWFEVDLAALTAGKVPTVNEVSKLPPVRRDLAVVVDEKVAVQSLLTALQSDKAPFVVELGLFDVYRGKGVEDGKKSLAFRVLLQDTQKTLTEIEIDNSIARLVAVLQRHGAQMRV
jgi:phenylalanyl-tRNA synthetase beta subunit